jgi:hypothetical protein
MNLAALADALAGSIGLVSTGLGKGSLVWGNFHIAPNFSVFCR